MRRCDLHTRCTIAGQEVLAVIAATAECIVNALYPAAFVASAAHAAVVVTADVACIVVFTDVFGCGVLKWRGRVRENRLT